MIYKSNTYENLITNLMYLRKDKGFTASRLRNTRTLLGLLGGSGQGFADLKARFVSAINSMADKRAVSLLLAAYALAPDYADASQLSERRQAYGQAVGLKSDALAKHENAAVRELAIQLLTARYTFSPLPFSPNVVPHNAALHEYVEIATVVKNQHWQETRETYKLISLVDNVGWLEISSDIPAIVTSTCKAKVKTGPSSGGLRHRFYFDELLMRGDIATLTFTMTPDERLADPDKRILHEETRAFHEPTLIAKYTVTFIGEQPTVIWQYDHLAIYERPGEPSERQLLTPDANGIVQADFTDLYGGLYSGVAWEW